MAQPVVYQAVSRRVCSIWSHASIVATRWVLVLSWVIWLRCGSVRDKSECELIQTDSDKKPEIGEIAHGTGSFARRVHISYAPNI